MSARPGRILAAHAVEGARPRSLTELSRDGRLPKLKARVLDLLRAEVRPG